jgi:hypothetical protein
MKGFRQFLSAKDKTAMLSACTDTAAEEEPAILSVKGEGFTMHKLNK